MQIPTGELDTLRSGIGLVVAELNRVTDDTPPDAGDATSLPVLTGAFDQLFEVMARVEGDREGAGSSRAAQTGTGDITEIGEYAFKLHENLKARVDRSKLQELKQPMALLAIDFALWVARHDGQIDTLEPVVDAFAMVANNTPDTPALEALSKVMARIITAVSPLIREDLEKLNPGRPWRLLLLNHGIVATRSHNTATMDAAFSTLTRYLPEDAARFFTEGMKQMEALAYPPQVREVMEKYHRKWTLNRTLH